MFLNEAYQMVQECLGACQNIYDEVFLSKSLFSEIKAKDIYLDKSFIQNSSIFDIYRASYGELAGYLAIANQFPV